LDNIEILAEFIAKPSDPEYVIEPGTLQKVSGSQPKTRYHEEWI
jgi:hypothetical protein